MQVVCEQCGTTFSVDSEKAIKHLTCPSCGHKLLEAAEPDQPAGDPRQLLD